MPALPATAAESEEEDAEEIELEEVQVTGTRIQNPNVTSANPITSITGEEMRQLGIVNVADALLMLVPQNISTYQPGLTGDIQGTGGGEFGNIGTGFGNGTQGNNEIDRGSLFIGNTVANLRGMDPVFGTRTLTLIDGRRTVSSSSQADIVDMNIIPSNLLERMDVVTGGASATYGSGAMAGVVNLVLASRRTGFSVDMDYGVNEAGDGGSPHLSLSGGMRVG
jgi:outer membrane receptor for ferrienterochelin and colicin